MVLPFSFVFSTGPIVRDVQSVENVAMHNTAVKNDAMRDT